MDPHVQFKASGEPSDTPHRVSLAREQARVHGIQFDAHGALALFPTGDVQIEVPGDFGGIRDELRDGERAVGEKSSHHRGGQGEAIEIPLRPGVVPVHATIAHSQDAIFQFQGIGITRQVLLETQRRPLPGRSAGSGGEHRVERAPEHDPLHSDPLLLHGPPSAIAEDMSALAIVPAGCLTSRNEGHKSDYREDP